MEIGAAIEGALSLRAGVVGADDIQVAADGNGISRTTERLPTRFAMPFADYKAQDTGTELPVEGEATRAEKVRQGFNSPFWPFVLVSTSVGQEGLDFHPYCHSLIHWNLPSNPVDLEQREGGSIALKGTPSEERCFATRTRGTRRSCARPVDHGLRGGEERERN